MGVDEIIEGVLRWFEHVKRMERIANRVYVGECRSVDRPRNRWIDTVKHYLKKRGLDIRQARE